ncbi:alpha/beta-hydrolase [Lophiostoma macrostomum CBS 122681]|uniref:Alpha/beta-hydrolase n=1 Tax=Lophiostoma macrostomum CBS 122681 TaxID=1314788 RepID=A0A6A6TVE1_9PLEO|nr:alpha/beta-hydrolase [Lophiostoma macrostomum CBS 122681]
MSSSKFEVVEHTSPCSHVRGFPNSVKRNDAVLHLAVKEYRPLRSLASDEDAVTVLACHAIGFPKESYEPLFEDLLEAENGFKIRSIWIADVANQGASYALNEADLGDDPNWLDHSRDLLLMVDTFRDRMKAPYVGLGHSFGGFQIVNLALIHPSLFHSIILIDPFLQDFAPPGPNAALMASMRRDTWDSRAAAEKQMSKNPFFKAMDPRVLQKYLKFGLRDLPDGKVTLATPKSQEAWSFVRSNFEPVPEDTNTVEARRRERLLSPDMLPFSAASTMMYARPETVPVLDSVSHLRPRTLFVHGEYSHINHEEIREMQLSKVGVGPGGNGGVADGGVETAIVEDGSHLCCFEKPAVVAADAANWLKKETARWKEEKEFYATLDRAKSKDDIKELSEKWVSGTKLDANVQRPAAKGTAKL